jgi:molecular chaperone GrpE
MSEKRTKKNQPDELIETPLGAVPSSAEEEMPGNGEQSQGGLEQSIREEIEALKKQLEEARAKAAENLDGWQRAQAEFVNYKNRIQRDREQDYFSMKGDIIKKVLPVLDDMERALANRPDNNANPWANGLELIARKFQTVLEVEGLKRIEAKGQPFDPNFHEAISSEPSEDVESGHVIEIVQNGYMLGERVIRPAMVRVAQ